jgi:hypothetical protein
VAFPPRVSTDRAVAFERKSTSTRTCPESRATWHQSRFAFLEEYGQGATESPHRFANNYWRVRRLCRPERASGQRPYIVRWLRRHRQQSPFLRATTRWIGANLVPIYVSCIRAGRGVMSINYLNFRILLDAFSNGWRGGLNLLRTSAAISFPSAYRTNQTVRDFPRAPSRLAPCDCTSLVYYKSMRGFSRALHILL